MVYVLMKNKQGEKVGGQVVKGIKLTSPEGTHYTVISTHRRGINKYEVKLESDSGASRSVMNYDIGHKSDWVLRGSFHTPEELAKIFGKSKVDPDANKPRHERRSFWAMKSKPGTHNYKQKERLMKDQPEKYKKLLSFSEMAAENETPQFFTESAGRANKFNIHWQIVRVGARDIKDIDSKINHVMKFLNAHKNIHNYGRVHNWVKMTGVAYKGDDRKKFEDALDSLEKNKDKYSSTEDNDNDLSKVSTENLKKVHQDLSKRKYGFQYKSVPKAHTEFMGHLDNELKSRE